MLSFFPRDVLDEIWDLTLRVFLPTLSRIKTKAAEIYYDSKTMQYSYSVKSHYFYDAAVMDK